MNIMELIGIVILIFLCSILPYKTFKKFLKLRNEGTVKKYSGLLLFVFTTLAKLALFFGIINTPSGFGPEYETVVIKQNIGGKLLCNSVYTADIHSYETNINYNYINKNGDTIEIGNGSYNGKNWEKNEQLIKLGNWLILKTGGWRDNASLILKNTVTDSAFVYDFRDHVNDRLGMPQNQQYFNNTRNDESYIERIYDDEVTIKYKYTVYTNSGRNKNNCVVKYKIDKETGYLKVIKNEID